MDLKSLPKELVEKRDVIECNFILSLYKDIDSVSDYANLKADEDVLTEDGKFYWILLNGLKKAGFQTADNMSIYTFLEDKKTLKSEFEKRGGYRTVKEITDMLSVENTAAYYDELIKNNLMIRLHIAGFNILSQLNKLKTMTSEEVYDYYEYQLANISLGKIEKVKAEDLSDGYDGWIERMDQGVNIGYRVGSKLMDYQLAGIHKGNLMLYLGGIGQGKTSSAVNLYLLPAIEDGNDVTVICNEQSSDEYRNMIISAVLFGKIGNVKGMNRMSLQIGHFTDYQKEMIREAVNWIKTRPGKIYFVEMQNYDIVNVRKTIKKHAKMGCGLFFFDTLKAVNDASDKSWGELSEVAKTLFLTAKSENVAVIASAQLAADSMSRKYLDLTAVGKSRAISECASTVVGFRPIMNNEIDTIRPYKYKKNPDGSNSRVKVYTELKPDEHYIIQFIMKNRFGNTSPQIVLKFNQSFNTIEDVGYYDAVYDDFKRN